MRRKIVGILALLWVFGAVAMEPILVPSREAVGERIANYQALRGDLATGGSLNEGAVALLAQSGFRTVLDLRTPEEGTAAEQAELAAAGLRYINIPVGKELPDEQVRNQFRDVIDDPANRPLLVHCASGNRVGTLWALYRHAAGAPLEAALEEGRTIGMAPGREAQIREQQGP